MTRDSSTPGTNLPDLAYANMARCGHTAPISFIWCLIGRLQSAAFIAALASGCAAIPTQELSQYRAAFAKVQDASEEVLIDFAAAEDAAAKPAAYQRSGRSAILYSIELDSLGTEPSGTIEVRRLALRTIDKFNNTLVTLAEGKSIEAVQNTAAGFVEAAGKFVTEAAGSTVPGLFAVVSGVRTLAGAFEKARLREEFETAVRDGAPIIDRMLRAFIDERSDHLKLRASEADAKNLAIVNAITASTRTLRDLIAGHAAGPGDDPLPEIQEKLDKALKPVALHLNFSIPLSLKHTPGMSPFATDQRAIAIQALSDIQEQSRSYEANATQYERLRDALNSYGVMLEKTRVALKVLVEALDRPVRFEDAAEELFQVAFRLKRDFEAFKAARKAFP